LPWGITATKGWYRIMPAFNFYLGEKVIPVKWYIAIMLSAGVCMFGYGLVNGEANVVFGSFLFLGMGGLVYFISRRS
jgi:hypothetical protein